VPQCYIALLCGQAFITSHFSIHQHVIIGDLNPLIAEYEFSRDQLPGLPRKTGYFSFVFFVRIVCFHVCGCSLNFAAFVAKMASCSTEYRVFIVKTFDKYDGIMEVQRNY